MAERKRFIKPIAYSTTPTELETAMAQSLPPEVRQISVAEVKESLPPPKPKKPMSFVPAPTLEQEKKATEERIEREGQLSWSAEGMIMRWVGMLEGITEGTGLKDAMTIMAMEGMPGEPMAPNRIGALRTAGKNKLADELQRESNKAKKSLLNNPERYADIEKGYDELEKDVALRNKENGPLWNTISDVGDVVAALPALGYSVFGPSSIRPGESERQKGKEFGKLFSGGFIGGTGYALRHPGKSFTARPILTLTTWLPMVKAGIIKPVKGVRNASQLAKLKRLEAAGEGAAMALADSAVSRLPIIDLTAEKIAQVKRVIYDGLAQGDKATTMLVEDLIMNPRATKSRVESLVDRLGKLDEKVVVDKDGTKVRGPKRETVEFRLDDTGTITYDTKRQRRQYEARHLFEKVDKKIKDLVENVKRNKEALEDVFLEQNEINNLEKPAVMDGVNPTVQWAKIKKQKLNLEERISALRERGASLKKEIRKQQINRKYFEAGKPHLADLADLEGVETPRRPVRTANPRFDKIADTMWASLEGSLPAKYGTTKFQFKSYLLQAFSDDSLVLLKSSGFRKVVVDFLVKEAVDSGAKVNKGKMRQEFNRVLKDAADSAGVKGEMFPNIVVNNKEIFSAERLPEIVASLRDRKWRDILSRKIKPEHLADDVIQRIGGEVAADLQTKGIIAGIESQAKKYAGETVAPYGENIIKSILLEGEVLPVALRFAPEELVSSILNNKTSIIKRITSEALETDRWIKHLPEKVDRIVERLKEFEKAPAEYGGGYVAPGFKNVLHWQNIANRTLNDPSGWRSLMRAMKAQLTARNIPTHKNNLQSNAGVMLMRRGTIADPLRFIAQPLKLWRDFKKNKIKDPQTQKMMEAIEATGILDTDLIDAEVGTIRYGVGKLPGYKQFNQGLEGLYKNFGDGALKLEETIYNYKKLYKDYATLKDGESIGFWVSPRKKVILEKTAKGFVQYTVGQKRRGRKLLSETELAELTAQGAKEPPLAVYFDYADAPIALQWLKAAPILGIASPFFTWSWKALDFPGKRGLMSRTLEGGLLVDTNNKTILARQLADATRISLMRSGVINGMREQLSEYKDLGKLFKWMPSSSSQQLVVALTNPAYVLGADFSGASWGGPTELLFRGFTEAYITAAWGEKELEKMYPTDRELEDLSQHSPKEAKEMLQRRSLWSKHMNGELWSASQALDLIGLAGSPILDMVQYIEDTDQPYKTFNMKDVYKRFGALMLGGTLHRIADITLARYDNYKDLSTRSWAIREDDRETEDFIRWSIRRVSGMGYTRPKNIFTGGKKYFSQMETRWKASLVHPLSRKVKKMESEMRRLEREGKEKTDEYTNIEEMVDGMLIKVARYESIISFEIGKMKDDFYDLADKIEKGTTK